MHCEMGPYVPPYILLIKLNPKMKIAERHYLITNSVMCKKSSLFLDKYRLGCDFKMTEYMGKN